MTYIATYLDGLTGDEKAEVKAGLNAVVGGEIDADLRPDLASTATGKGAGLVTFTPEGAGAKSETLAAVLNRAFVWPEHYDTMQEAFDAAAARQVELRFMPGKTYTWPSSKVTVTDKVRVVAVGARIECSAAITALEFQAGADGSGVVGGVWVYTGSRTSGYNSSSMAMLFTGTRNGAGVAPTFLEDVETVGCTFLGWGNIAVEYRFTRNSRDRNIRVIDCGYAGVFTYSVGIHRSSGLFVNGLNGQLDTGVAATSELNAYGFTATALTGGTPDRVRDPVSWDIIVEDFWIINVPTWHAVDSHGADNMTVKNGVALNCRRGVVFTALSDVGTKNSTAQNVTCVNNFAASATNANGTSKKGEAFWDIGPSGSIRNQRNRFEGCYSFGHGSPASVGSDGLGAVTIANADDGYYGIEDVQSFRVGWLFGSNISRASIKARSTDTRSASINPSVARIEGDDIDLRVIEWISGPRNSSVDTNVMVNGLLVAATNTGCTIDFQTFDLTDCTAGELVSTSGTAIAATLTGNVSLDVILTGTGMTTSPTCVASCSRNGRLVSVQIPSAGLNGTSNADTFTLTGLPANYRPSAARGGTIAALDGSNYILAQWSVGTDGVITLTRDADNNTSAWTTSGLKGVRSGCMVFNV